MITYKLDEKDQILYVNRTGEITIDDLKEYIERIDEEFGHLDTLHILTDTSDSQLEADFDKLQGLTGEIEKRLPRYREVRDAMVVDTPMHAALSQYFEEAASQLKNYWYKTFTTETAARDWLKF